MKEWTFNKQEIDDFRAKFKAALLAVKSNGKQFLSERQAQHIVDGYSDESLAYDMQWNTPETLAQIFTM
ncbi:MAG: hypothetical protein IJ640_00560 [Prevotella sp.]|nr:hypothetical protein [Prevotella sp.]